MYPSECDEVVLILYIEQFFLIEGLAGVSLALLLGDDDVRDVQDILRLQGGK